MQKSYLIDIENTFFAKDYQVYVLFYKDFANELHQNTHNENNCILRDKDSLFKKDYQDCTLCMEILQVSYAGV